MYLSYPFDFSRYVLQLDNGNIVVESQIKNFNHYFPFLGKVVQDTVRNQKLFGLSRDGDVLSIGETSLQRFRCSADPESLKGKKLKLQLTEETKEIAASFGLACSPELICTQGKGSADDVFVKISPSFRESLTARFNDGEGMRDQSRLFTCTFLNRMIERGASEVVLLPMDDAEKENGNDVAVHIEAGRATNLEIINALQDVIR